MKNRKTIFTIFLITFVMIMTTFSFAFADEVEYSTFNLINENSGYKIVVPNFIELREVEDEWGGIIPVLVMEVPEKDENGKYPIFEVVTTDERAYNLVSFPGAIDVGQEYFIDILFEDNRAMYDLGVDILENREDDIFMFDFGVLDEEGYDIFIVTQLYFSFESKEDSTEEDLESNEEEVPSNEETTSDEEELPSNEEELSSTEEELPSDWAIEEVEKAKEYNLVTEKVLSNYQQNITREELCELTVKLYEALSGEAALVPDTNKFSDTENAEVLKANALGIINGVNETEFAPTANVTREEIATMFYRTLEAVDESLVISDSEVTFADKAEISSWALDAVGFMSEQGIIGGVGDNKVDPKGNASREVGIVLIKRTLEKFQVN